MQSNLLKVTVCQQFRVETRLDQMPDRYRRVLASQEGERDLERNKLEENDSIERELNYLTKLRNQS